MTKTLKKTWSALDNTWRLILGLTLFFILMKFLGKR
jgi:uncharacterized membrane protein YcaP (DUF421 family)